MSGTWKRSPKLRPRVRPVECWPRSNRLGLGLLHTVLLIAVMGMLMSLTAIVLGKSFQTYQTTLTHYQTIHLLQQASDRLRSDVHQASTVEIDGGRLRLNLLSRGDVVYALNEGQLERSVEQDSGSPAAKQAWKMPTSTQIDWELQEAGGNDQRYPVLIARLSFRVNAESSDESSASRVISTDSLALDEITWLARVGVEKRNAASTKSEASAAPATEPTDQSETPAEEAKP